MENDSLKDLIYNLACAEEQFSSVVSCFGDRPQMQPDMTPTAWQAEFDFRLTAMERKMKRLSDEGLFGRGRLREKIAVLVEVMPPDATNIDRANRLNPPSALEAWLEEAAEV